MVDESGLFTRSQGFTIHVVPATGIGMGEIDNPSVLAVHPNPVLDILYITAASNTASRTVRITDALGRIVMETHTATGTIDVSSLRPGSYVLRTENAFARFVKQ